MNNYKNIYIGAMSGTSHDAVDVSILKIEKDITLNFFYSKRIPNSLRTRIKNIIESDSTSLVELGQLNKKLGYLFGQAINESIEKAKLKKNKVRCVAISGQTIRHDDPLNLMEHGSVGGIELVRPIDPSRCHHING